MRPTWHFVAADDLRWLLGLTAPRVHQASGYQYRQLGIDAAEARRAADVFVGALEGGRSKTRDELGIDLRAAGMEAVALRLGYLIGHAELEMIIVNGPRKGKRQTYALFDERVPPSDPVPRDLALARLAQRYIEGHGPAQDIDLAWWSGLTLRDARRALEAAAPAVTTETIGDRTFWIPKTEGELRADERSVAHLLPNYDELLIAFRDRSDATDPDLPPPARVAAEILAHVLVRNGLVVGGWRRTETGALGVRLELNPLVQLTGDDRAAFRAALDRFAAFLGREVTVSGLD